VNTYDIETFVKNEVVVPYCICFILNDEEHSLYYNDKDLINESLKIISEKSTSDSVIFYVHNINFDGLLILGSLQKSGVVFDLIKRGLNIYAISFEYLGVLIEFKCSYKLLPLSLSYLAKFVNLEKTPFPYDFVNENTLFYNGATPSKKFFKSEKDFVFFSKKPVFDMRRETIEYCLNDVKVLKKILDEVYSFIKSLGNDYKRLFNSSYSIPSFSHKIFFKKYNTLGITKNLSLEYKTYVKKSYFGGRCEVFGNPIQGEITHHFDFSGMYGQCMMQKFPYGVLKIKTDLKDFLMPGFYHINYKSDN
jgi:hypothetical protein